MKEKQKSQDEIFNEELAKSEALWKPYYKQRDELIERHAWVKGLLKGGGGSLSGFHPKEPFAVIEERMRSSGEIMKHTSYYHPVEKQKFIHFTSVQAFKEIMNSGVIRLYNPNFGNDPNEVLFGAKERYQTKVDSEATLKNLFALSMNQLEAKEDLTMWKLYGNDGYGVGLVFELENPVEHWRNWYFGKVLYGESEELNRLDEFHKDYKSVQSKMGPPPLLDIDIIPIYAFHKSGLFHSENEVRLLHYRKSSSGMHEYKKPFFPDGMQIKKTLNGQLKEVYYLEYPIYWKQNREEIIKLEGYTNGPQIRLKEVVLGHRFKPYDVGIIKSWCLDLMVNEYNWDKNGRNIFKPEVTISSLHSYFNS